MLKPFYIWYAVERKRSQERVIKKNEIEVHSDQISATPQSTRLSMNNTWTAISIQKLSNFSKKGNHTRTRKLTLNLVIHLGLMRVLSWATRGSELLYFDWKILDTLTPYGDLAKLYCHIKPRERTKLGMKSKLPNATSRQLRESTQFWCVHDTSLHNSGFGVGLAWIGGTVKQNKTQPSIGKKPD